MKLFERITVIADSIAGSQTRLAKAIGVPQGTFNGYLSDEGQRKIRVELLESILRVFPEVNRDWLFFGEGDMLSPASKLPPKAESSPVDWQHRIAELEAELKEERRLNRDLTRRLLENSCSN